jgi:subtilisin family serine protease
VNARGRSTALAAAIVALVSIAASAALAKQAPAPEALAGESLSGHEVVPGELIVRFERGASKSDRSVARAAVDAGMERKLLLSRTQLVQVTPGTEQEAAAKLERDPSVAYAEANLVVHADVTPNDDPRFTDLWGLNNTGQTVNGVAGTADADIDGREGWNLGAGLGSSVRVAAVDSGVARTHPDLAPNMFTNPGESGGGKQSNGIDDDGNGLIDDFRGWDFVNDDNNPADDEGHGTHVAGTIAARSNNSLGVAGTASFPTPAGSWLGPKILAVKVLDEEGSGTLAGVADGLVYAGTMNAKAANASLSVAGTNTTFDNAIKSRPNTLYVVTAGNTGTNNDTTPRSPCNPATTPDAANKLCVAATDSSDALASFSNFGAVNVDLAAPGVDILSTVPTTGTFFTEDFETPLTGRWTTNDAGQTGAPRWGRTTLFSTSPTHSITDSPAGNYVNNQDNWARNTTGIDLTGGVNCKLTAQAKIDTENNFDDFSVEFTRTPANAGSWISTFFFSGAGQGRVTADVPSAFNGQPGVFVRFRLDSDVSTVDDGAYVDDVAVRCFISTFDATSYEFFDGTSMAAPHVTGAAAFLFTKLGTATVAQVKDKILRSVDKKASLNGQVASGGRLNLYKAAAESTAAVSGGVLTFTAGLEQKNNVTVTRFMDAGVPKYRITDPYSTSPTVQQSGSRIKPGAGCTRVNDTSVKCPVAGITRIVLNGGHQNDSLNAGTIAIPVTLDGGGGMDALTGGTAGDSLIGGTAADAFTAGTGNDTIGARNEDLDTSFSCGENAGDSDTVNADLSPNDPITASPANCEVVNKL